MNVKIEIHTRNLKARKETIKDWEISQEDKKDLLKFLDELSLGFVNKGFKVSESRQLKYLDILKIPLQYWNKPTSKLTLKDVKDFEKDLSSNELKSIKKKTPFTHSTKCSIRRILKIYLKWKLKDNPAKFLELTDWFDLKEKVKTPEFLKEEEINKLYKACKSAEERFLIAVLFDSGARAEEFHNIRYEDIELPKGNEEFVKLTLKEEYSKTAGRVISLYWKYSLEAVRDYLQEREKEGIKSNEQVFNKTYDNSRQFLRNLGEKVLGKNIHYHLFRSSSATFLASRMNRQQLCYRYGWRFSSRMVDTYISRAGMENLELDEKFKGTEIEELKNEIEKEKKLRQIEREKLEDTNTQLSKLSESIFDAIKQMKEGKKLIVVKDVK